MARLYLALGVLVVAIVCVTDAVPFARSSFMQVEPDGSRCAFKYYGIHQNNQTVRLPIWSRGIIFQPNCEF